MLAQESKIETLHYQEIVAERDRRWHFRPDLKIYGDGGPRWYIDKVGITAAFTNHGLALPSLLWALRGKRHGSDDWHDPLAGRVWHLKDTMPGQKEAWYGRFVKGKPVFISLGLFPAFYALSPNFGELDDYLEQYQDGLLSEQAKRIYEAVLNHGPATTTVLHRQVGTQKGGEAAVRFDKAVAELVAGFKIMPVGVGNDNRWKYCFIYDVVPRHLPEQVLAARQLTSGQAMQQIISTYLRHAYAVPADYFSYLFGWQTAAVTRAINALSERGEVAPVQVLGGEVEERRRKAADSWLAWQGEV